MCYSSAHNYEEACVRETVRIRGMLHGIQCLCHQAIQDQPAAVDDQYIAAGFLWIVGASDLEHHVTTKRQWLVGLVIQNMSLTCLSQIHKHTQSRHEV